MTIKELNDFCKNTLISHLEIEFLDYGQDYVVARMPVNNKKVQPLGILHGGATLALAETVASVGSFLLIDRNKYTTRGLQVSANHVSAVRGGDVFARAQIIHKGQMTHIWEVKVTNSEQKPVSFVRVTMIVLDIEQLREKEGIADGVR